MEMRVCQSRLTALLCEGGWPGESGWSRVDQCEGGLLGGE